ncbi:tetratricopeptide repeat protein [Flavobacterium sp. GT3P67]|uniref:tetratricopeptide repeat-containing sensor histidine kinase n=1 Tax=Flavobacterium sp. GT3P67 TaxID=2541722 RepID=UPI00104DF8F9|nr:tetratricopeptide repeat protein [Flavobacterium sp. GT3P67]TDE55019.1 tetratricopeptide repeat protein [Flavobacterium sp. GT3P67]
MKLLKNSYYIFLLLLLVCSGCVKKGKVIATVGSPEDSITSYLSFAKDNSLSLLKKQEYNKKAFVIIISQPNDSMNKVKLFRVANRYYNMGDWKGYKETVHLVLENSKSSKDSVNMAKGYVYLGDYYSSQAVSDSAFLYYSKAEKIYRPLQDNYNLAKTLFNKANLQYIEGDFMGSELAVFNALRAIKGGKAIDVVYDSYNLLGIVYNEREEYDRALEYHTKALANIDETVLPSVFQSRATSLNNLGYVYQNMNKYKEAKKYFEQGLEQKNLISDKPFVYAMLLDNLAYSKFKLKESKGLPELFYQSLKLRDSLQLTAGIILNKIHLSEYFASKGDTLRAMEYSKEALATAQSSKNSQNVLASLKQLAIIEPKKAAVYNKEYIHINDSLQKAERKMGEKFSRIEYETDKIKDENTNLEVQNRNLVFIFSGLAMLGLFIFVIKAQKTKNRELLFKQQQQEANEEIYNLMISQQNTIEGIRIKEKKRVAQELHDGVLGRMFGIRMNLDSLNKIHDGTAVEKRNNYLTELKSIEQDIREISHDLNREKSELINNFVAIVDNLLEEQKKTFKPKLFTSIDRSIKWELLSNSIKINLYRIIQESLQNINKYAEANTIKVELKKIEDDLFLTISDDGNGFDVNKSKKGIGLQNIQSRTIECNGTVDIKSKKGNGTIITIAVPFENKQILT